MPKGHRAGREVKKTKKKADSQTVLTTPLFTSTEVEVIKKEKKTRKEP